MSALDLIILVLIVYAAVRGYMKGVIMELANIVAVFIGLFATIHFAHFVSSFFALHFSWDSNYIKPVAFVITFIGFLLLFQLLARFLDKTLKKIGLGIFIRIAGILVGILKVILIIGALFFVLQYLNVRTKNQLFDEKFLTESKLADPIKNITNLVLPLDKF
jgi:membrane protein required for colicin V production